jgi:NAD(P)-dependent dehydrogenase (short-subunit alcohol dehydrogenase family)
MELKDKIVVVTGGATGIGRAAAICCARAGARVILGDIADTEMEETVRQVEVDDGLITAIHTDISSSDDVERLMDVAAGESGRIDVLINCAGVLEGPFVPLEDFDLATYERVIDINLKGSFLAAKNAAKYMQKHGRGVVILISSGAGVTGGSSSVAYASSKGGVHGLYLVLRGQLQEHGIRVHCICPGGISTPLKLRVVQADADKMEGTDLERSEEFNRQAEALGDPMGVGKILAFLASDDAEYVRGTLHTR